MGERYFLRRGESTPVLFIVTIILQMFCVVFSLNAPQAICDRDRQVSVFLMFVCLFVVFSDLRSIGFKVA